MLKVLSLNHQRIKPRSVIILPAVDLITFTRQLLPLTESMYIDYPYYRIPYPIFDTISNLPTFDRFVPDLMMSEVYAT